MAKRSKNQFRREKQKLRKLQAAADIPARHVCSADSAASGAGEATDTKPGVAAPPLEKKARGHDKGNPVYVEDAKKEASGCRSDPEENQGHVDDGSADAPGRDQGGLGSSASKVCPEGGSNEEAKEDPGECPTRGSDHGPREGPEDGPGKVRGAGPKEDSGAGPEEDSGAGPKEDSGAGPKEDPEDNEEASPVAPNQEAQKNPAQRSQETQDRESDTDDNEPKTSLLKLFSGLKDPPQDDPALAAQYEGVFGKFQEQEPRNALATTAGTPDQSESESEDTFDEPPREPRKKRRAQAKPSVAELKTATARPQLVEWFDADAPDPFLVVHLKTGLNHVDVPPHWQHKKDYLSAKRGSEKPPFRLPKYIASTGISEMRNHDPESLKKSQRDRVQPKMGRLDIDYQRLHDAFFKHQTAPPTLAFGHMYSEGRHLGQDDALASLRPGIVSEALRNAVGFGEGPPPWISLMQDLGKPPSYRNLIIPGLDVTYSNTGYRVQVPEGIVPLDFMADTWGEMEEGEESEEESGQSDQDSDDADKGEGEGGADVEVGDVGKDEGDEEAGGDEEDKGDADPDNESAKVEITEFSRYKNAATTSETTSSGTLYTVLPESTSGQGTGLLSGRQKYDMETSVPNQAELDKPPKPSEKKQDKFKF